MVISPNPLALALGGGPWQTLGLALGWPWAGPGLALGNPWTSPGHALGRPIEPTIRSSTSKSPVGIPTLSPLLNLRFGGESALKVIRLG